MTEWKTYADSVYAQRNAALAQMTTIQAAITNIANNPQASYSINGPDGSQSVDKNGMLAQLNDSLRTQQDIFDRCQAQILKFPFQLVSRGR